MDTDVKNLYQLFTEIKKKGWIESLRKGSTGIGYTFERLINKEEEDFPVPDYNSIEIKTKNHNSKEMITLFNAAPDGDIIFPIKELYEKYGFNNIKKEKIFYADIYSFPKYIGNRNRFKLNINLKEEKIKLIIIEKNDEIKYTNISWSFKMLKEKLEIKIKNLAIIKAKSRYRYGTFFYYYDEINFYKIKNFDTFLRLIEEGIIRITFKIGIYKSGKNIGKIYDHGTGFCIDEKNIEKLYIKYKS